MVTRHSLILIALLCALTLANAPADEPTPTDVAPSATPIATATAVPAAYYPTPISTRGMIDGIGAYSVPENLCAVLTASMQRLKICAPDMHAYVHAHIFVFRWETSIIAMNFNVVGLNEDDFIDEFPSRDIDEYRGMIMLVHEARHLEVDKSPGDEKDANTFTLPLFDRCPPTDAERAAVAEYRLLIEKRAGR